MARSHSRVEDSNLGQLQKANTRKFAQQADMLARMLA